MSTPAPTGIQVLGHGGGWFTLSWQPVPSADPHGYESEYAWGSGRRQVPESVMFAVAPGTTDWCRVRNWVGGTPSGWVKATIDDKGTIVALEGGDDQPEPPPAAPSGLRVVRTDAAQGTVAVAWDYQPEADYWEVMLDGAYSRWRKVHEPAHTFEDVQPDTTYRYQVRAIRRSATGAPVPSFPTAAQFTLAGQPVPPKPDPDPKPEPEPEPGPAAPATPTNVRAHCITHQSAKIEWDRDPAVMEYEVWVGGHRGESQHTAATLVTVNGLQPRTTYTAHVVAKNAHGESAAGQVTFTTGVAEPPPEVDPDIPTGADWDAPQLEVVPLENGRVRATWVDPPAQDGTPKPTAQMGYPFWHVSLDQRTWYFTRERVFEFDVQPGGEVFVSVYGVWDDTLTAIATKGVAL